MVLMNHVPCDWDGIAQLEINATSIFRDNYSPAFISFGVLAHEQHETGYQLQTSSVTVNLLFVAIAVLVNHATPVGQLQR